jgi:dinuclear metal center YbgI/SA1388 family protein
MAALTRIIDHLDGLLGPEAWEDYAPNGLQVPAVDDEVRRVVTGVSAHLELFERAKASGADLVLVHHGLFWRGQPLGVDRVQARRLRLLFEEDIALAAYHLPLDAHPVHGNNALLAAALGAQDWTPAFPHAGAPIGVVADFGPDGIGAAELLARVQAVTGRGDVVAFLTGPDPVRRFGICCGAAADDLPTAVALGLDGLLTGEPAERCMAIAREYGVHFLAAGHHATERLGVQRLGELLVAEFGVEHEFCDVPNPI